MKNPIVGCVTHGIPLEEMLTKMHLFQKLFTFYLTEHKNTYLKYMYSKNLQCLVVNAVSNRGSVRFREKKPLQREQNR
jgi:hypothetical protein